MPYVIGVDGGGTKTTVMIAPLDHDDHMIQQTYRQSSNPLISGENEIAYMLLAKIKMILNHETIHPTEIKSICLGLAGVQSTSIRKNLHEIMFCLLLQNGFLENVKINLVTDLEIALKGSLGSRHKEGIMVISGTGSNAIGIDHNKNIYRCGGWGEYLGDEGSGYFISRQALMSVMRAHDGRGHSTVLKDRILGKLNLQQVDDLILLIQRQRNKKKFLASLSPLVFDAAEEGDVIANQILSEAALELTNHVKAIHSQSPSFSKQTPIFTAGSIFNKREKVLNEFNHLLSMNELGVYEPSEGEPVHGAIQWAKEMISL
ncbi:N-acetylglucosamine kinase [Metabacillus fastidiosus]|uniref:N-acetylglucosamine kinase n=1 Tax=Metabacillus fastidiosus TaxID=1458 RepID=UPI003D29135C